MKDWNKCIWYLARVSLSINDNLTNIEYRGLVTWYICDVTWWNLMYFYTTHNFASVWDWGLGKHSCDNWRLGHCQQVALITNYHTTHVIFLNMTSPDLITWFDSVILLCLQLAFYLDLRHNNVSRWQLAMSTLSLSDLWESIIRYVKCLLNWPINQLVNWKIFKMSYEFYFSDKYVHVHLLMTYMPN